MRKCTIGLIASGFAFLSLAVCADVFRQDLPPDNNGAINQTVFLKQEMFTSQPRDYSVFIERFEFESPKGNAATFDKLPDKAQETLSAMWMRISPRVEIRSGVVREAVRMIISKPKPASTIRLGLISDTRELEPDPKWLNDLAGVDKIISCALTNVSFLDLAVVLADTIGCEFGVTAEGDVLFRNKDQKAKADHRIYVISPKRQVSK